MSLEGSELTGMGSVPTAQGQLPSGTPGGPFPGFLGTAPPAIAVVGAAGASGKAADGSHTHQLLSAVPVATRAALALIDSALLTVGTIGYVADLGDGQPQIFVLELDARAADAKLRIAALNKAGYLWVAGNGRELPRTYISAKIDWAVATTYAFTPAFAAAGWRFMYQTPRYVISDLAGTVSTIPVQKAGNWSPSFDNLSGGAFPSAAVLNGTIGAGVPMPLNFTAPITSGNTMTDLSAAGIYTVSSAATGIGLTLKGYFVLSGLLVPTETFA